MKEVEKGFIAGFLLNQNKSSNENNFEPLPTKWTYPSDWLLLSAPSINQIKLLIVTPYGGTYYKAGFSIVCTKSIHINWGDGSSSKISSIGNIVETHTYKKDTGHIAKKPYNLSEENEYCEQWIVTITFEADSNNETDYIKYLMTDSVDNTSKCYMNIYAIKIGHIGYLCNSNNEELYCYGSSLNLYYMKICNGNKFKINDASELRKLELPKSMTKLGDYALANCYSLFDVDLSNITELGSYALHNCNSLDPSGKMPKLIKVGNYAFYLSGISNINFPNLEEIGDHAFFDCYHLESITIPEKVTAIPKHCFSSCYNLSQITLQNVTLIDEYSFTNCLTLSAIKDNKITNIMNWAFDNCHNLRSVYLPCCNSIGDSAFRGCSSLCDVTLQSGCEFNSDNTTLRTFYECNMLDRIKYGTESEESST